MRFRPNWASWFLLSNLACGGGSAQPTAIPPPSGPPVANFIQTPEGQAIVGLTAVGFRAVPDAFGPATYFWSFGDGTTGSGATVTHVYDLEGTFNVVLTATNVNGSNSATAPITTRSLTGLWRPDFLNASCFQLRFTQAGSTVDAVASSGSAVTVAVQSPREIVLTIAAKPSQNCGDQVANRKGTFDAALNSFTVPINDTGQADIWRRQ